jgi:uncharacterized protein (DUF2336 family)
LQASSKSEAHEASADRSTAGHKSNFSFTPQRYGPAPGAASRAHEHVWMAAAAFPVSELDDVVAQADPARRADVARRICDLFVQGAATFRSEHVALFDGVLLKLAGEGDVDIRSELAQRFCSMSNAPPALIGRLAQDEDIGIAGPLLRRSMLIDDPTLVELAKNRGQTHLMAIAARASISSPITDVILRRGDRDVVRAVAGNAGAAFSAAGFGGLIRRATQDDMLAVTVGGRNDLPPLHLKNLLACATEAARRRLITSARPSTRIAINRAIRELAGEPTKPVMRRDFAPAQRTVAALLTKDSLGEAAVQGFAKAHQYEETIAALSAMTAVRISTLDQLVSGERHDPVLIIGKALGFDWATVNVLIELRLGPDRAAASPDIEEARHNFEHLAPQTTHRVLGFWRLRQANE